MGRPKQAAPAELSIPGTSAGVPIRGRAIRGVSCPYVAGHVCSFLAFISGAGNMLMFVAEIEAGRRRGVGSIRSGIGMLRAR